MINLTSTLISSLSSGLSSQHPASSGNSSLGSGDVGSLVAHSLYPQINPIDKLYLMHNSYFEHWRSAPILGNTNSNPNTTGIGNSPTAISTSNGFNSNIAGSYNTNISSNSSQAATALHHLLPQQPPSLQSLPHPNSLLEDPNGSSTPSNNPIAPSPLTSLIPPLQSPYGPSLGGLGLGPPLWHTPQRPHLSLPPPRLLNPQLTSSIWGDPIPIPHDVTPL